MKKFLFLLAASLVMLSSCEQKPELYNVKVQLKVDGAAVNLSDIKIQMTDGFSLYEGISNESGQSYFSVAEGVYSIVASGTLFSDGERFAYNGAVSNISVLTDVEVSVDLKQSKSNQIILKELYFGGCPDNSGTKSYSNDGYVILYNNSESDVDASNTVFCIAAPYNSQATNKYYTSGVLSYENAGWIPSISAIWWFTSNVTIPAYSQIVIAFYGAVDHTATYTNSVNLANPDYYWMSNTDVSAYTNAKYVVSDVIPAAHYLSCSPFTKSNAFTLSNSSPAFYIGKMDKATALQLSQDTEGYDHTLGAGVAFNVVKFPKANIIDAVEVFAAASLEKSQLRFSADINSGYVAAVNQKGYTIYRNVDKAATEALSENAGRIVYNYTGGTEAEGGSTDPSGIDAEASIKAGAHIIFSDTNNSATDFHQRKVSSLK